MKTIHTLIAMFMLACTVSINAGINKAQPALQNPLLLRSNGAYVEIKESEFLRSSQIRRIEGIIIVHFKIATKSGAKMSSMSFPLSKNSIAKISTLKSGGIGVVSQHSAEISIKVDDKVYILTRVAQDKLFTDEGWKGFQLSVTKATTQLQQLLDLTK